MKLFCLAASHRPDSYNRKLIALAASFLKKHGAQIDAADYGEYDMPPYNDQAREDGKIPDIALKLQDRLMPADGILIASPEYNWSYPGSLKNIIDWLSHFRPVPLTGKTSFLMCATPSRRGGALGLSHLKVPLEALGMYVYPEVFTLSEAHNAFSEDGKLTIPAAERQFFSLLQGYFEFTGKLKG